MHKNCYRCIGHYKYFYNLTKLTINHNIELCYDGYAHNVIKKIKNTVAELGNQIN